MAKKRKKSPYSFLGIRITDYNVILDGSVDYEVRKANLDDTNPDTRIYSFTSSLFIEGQGCYPEDNQNAHEITIYSGERYAGQFDLTLGDCHRKEKWQPVYKTKRGKQVPVYDVPKGIGFMSRVRGERKWQGTVWMSPHVLTDMLTLLPHIEPLYLSLHLYQEDRSHSIVGLSLQTQDPAET